MKIIVVGTGFVGLPHAAVLSEAGHEVYAYDIDPKKIAAYQSGEAAQIERVVNEPGLAATIAETKDHYLFFTSDISNLCEDTDVFFMCINTPPNRDGSTDLTYYLKAAHDIAGFLAQRKNPQRVVLVNKSTVPIGTARLLESVMHEHGVAELRRGLQPGVPGPGQRRRRFAPARPRGGWCGHGRRTCKILRRLYSQFVNHVRIRYLETTPETAEAIKYMSNTLLLTYISFWNGVGARLAEAHAQHPHGRPEDRRHGRRAHQHLGFLRQQRRGRQLLRQGHPVAHLPVEPRRPLDRPAAGGIHGINEYQKTYLIDRAIHEAQFNFNQKTVAFWGWHSRSAPTTCATRPPCAWSNRCCPAA
jgi:UDPglucose 6-dehydrogenase